MTTTDREEGGGGGGGDDGDDAGIEDAEFTVANSANVENVLKETFQGEEMTERKRSYARDHLLNSFVNASTSERRKDHHREERATLRLPAMKRCGTRLNAPEMRENAAMANCLNVSGVVNMVSAKTSPGLFWPKKRRTGEQI